MAEAYELNLRDYLRIVRKRHRIIMGLTLMCALATFFLTPRPQSSYHAQATVKLTYQSTVTDMLLDSVTWSCGSTRSTSRTATTRSSRT